MLLISPAYAESSVQYGSGFLLTIAAHLLPIIMLYREDEKMQYFSQTRIFE